MRIRARAGVWYDECHARRCRDRHGTLRRDEPRPHARRARGRVAGGEVLPLGTIMYYGARYGIPLSIKAADYIANRWKPGTVSALLSIFNRYYGCRSCSVGGGGSW